jgi:hypothetical protein
MFPYPHSPLLNVKVGDAILPCCYMLSWYVQKQCASPENVLFYCTRIHCPGFLSCHVDHYHLRHHAQHCCCYGDGDGGGDGVLVDLSVVIPQGKSESQTSQMICSSNLMLHECEEGGVNLSYCCYLSQAEHRILSTV